MSCAFHLQGTIILPEPDAIVMEKNPKTVKAAIIKKKCFIWEF